VLQANAPTTVSSFLQRLGRTGRRAGQRANTSFYCEHSEAVLQAIAIVELAKKGWIESARVQKRAWPVLVHQLLALSLQFGAISPEDCWVQICSVCDFSGITRTEFNHLVLHLLREDYLFSANGLLSLGDKAEKIFGRRNFMEIYAVFSSPVLYKVKTEAGYFVGSLEQDFVDKLVAETSSFLLGGRAWTVNQINHFDRIITASPAPAGKKPSWGGFSPQLLSFEICQQILSVLTSSEPLTYLDKAAQQALQEKREEIGSSLIGRGINLTIESNRILWWTFAGGQINHTLKSGFLLFHDWKIVSDNFCIRFEGESLSSQAIHDGITQMQSQTFWESATTQQHILAQLPNYRLSKFQQALPQQYSQEMVSHYLLDLPGTLRYLKAMLS
jgi:ATP-dependent helicase Lhr and Lhr-like helicase